MNYEELKSLLTEAEELNKKGKFQEAETLASELLGKLEKIGESTDTVTARQRDTTHCEALITLSTAKWRRGDLETALTLARAALDLAEEKNIYGETYAKALGTIGNVYKNLSDYPQALTYYQKALAIFEEIGSKDGIATNLGNIGIVYQNLSDYPQALPYFQKALAIYEEIGSKEGIANNLGNIGNVYQKLSDYPQALTYYQKSLAIYQEIGSKYGIAINLGNIGSVYQNLTDYPQALTYYQKALTIFEEIGSKEGIAFNLDNIGLVYQSLSDYSQALTYYQKAFAIYEEIGNKYGIATNLGNIGGLYASMEFDGYDTDKAEESFLSAIALFEDIGEKHNLYAVHKSLADLYEMQERWYEHSIQFKRYYSLEKEVQSEEATKQAQQMEHRRKIEESERDRQVKLAGFKAKENILHRVLPAQIAERIAEGEENIADYFPAVSILFADIEGFTPMSADMPAYVVVKFLNHVFSEFDHIMKKHGCEKIKTIGDGYMAVAGAPTECVDHAERITLAALEMMKPIELPDEIKTFIPSGKKFSIRIGLHTGSVVAGVVGEDRFVYDIYSDAVNTAARMESHGESGKIHVSSDFMRHLLNRFAQTKNATHGIIFENRGEMEVKGKGMMKTYFIEKAS